MIITKFDIENIVTQASSFSERLSNRLLEVNAAQVNEQEKSDERLERWCQVVAQGNWEKFHKRLQWDALDIDTVRLVISSLPIAENQPLPSWAATLQEVIKTASEWGQGTGQTQSVITDYQLPINIGSENPLPFEDLLLPAVHVARQKLLTHLGSPVLFPSSLPLELLSDEAYQKLESSLLHALVELCEKTLEFEFSHFRPFGYNVLNLLITDIEFTSEKTHYNAFVQKILQDGMLTFFQKYPVLGKLIATRVDFWIEATAEFIQRLKADITEIQKVFQTKQGLTEEGETERLIDGENSQLSVTYYQSPINNSQLGKVIDIKANLSDPHKRGRCVIALTFESGLKLIYKPKDFGLEVAYNKFLEWCNQQGVPLPFKILKLLNCQTYGWMEYVEHLPCEDEAAARHFYPRAGMLLCLLYVLGGTDCHYENLIASGENLVLIDTETIMHHEAKEMEDSPETTVLMPVRQQFWDSVLRTALLPRWDFNKDKRIAYDITGLGSAEPQALPERVLQWKLVNTDDMHRAYETVTMPVAKNVPTLNGMPLSPNNYLEELVEGFEQMYHFLIEQRQALLAESSPLKALSTQQVRFVFRATKVYGAVLQSALAPEFLQNGVDRSIELDILSRAFLTTQNKPNAWSILHSELRAMEQLDIPYFGANSNSDTLTVGLEQSLEGYFKAPSYSQVISRLQKLDETDLARQVAIIRGSFYARVARSPQAERSRSCRNQQAMTTSTQGAIALSTLLASEQFLAAACAIAEEIRSHAIKEADGSVYWIGLGYIPNAERFQFQPLGESLYDGNCGIALFLAALDYLKGSSEFRNLALDALGYTRSVLQAADGEFTQRWAKRIGIGGATGLGALVYSLVKISQFLKEPALIEDALKAANLIRTELIAADQQLDLLGGAAGTILGLLALYHETLEPTVLDKAIICGQHLLSARISIDGSPRAWKTIDEKPLTGFSHGAAGIAYALLRLYAVTGDRAYKQAASEGIAYERSVFSTSVGNWPDFRSFDQQNGQPGFMVNWCHGAPGIGLGRLGGLSILDTEEIHQDVKVALQATQKYGLRSVDNLCCGNFGRIEVLLVAAQKLSSPELLKTAREKSASVVARAAQTGGYQLFANLPNHVFSPSFFQGTAGIGYELLRLAYPETLPSVLLWE
jgi:type 2 lantibiotic biosynthesis protein LanM